MVRAIPHGAAHVDEVRYLIAMNAHNLFNRLAGISYGLITVFLTGQAIAQSATGGAAGGTPASQSQAPLQTQIPGAQSAPGENAVRGGSAQGSVEQPPPINPNVPNNPAAATNAAVYRDLFENNAALQDAGATLLDLQATIEQSLPLIYGMMTGRPAPAGSNPASGEQTNAVAAAGQVAMPALRGVRPGQVYLSMVGTNAFAMDAETMRLLYGLYNQLQGTLPLLRTINGVPVATGISNSNTPFVKRFTVLPTSPAAPLTPTGR